MRKRFWALALILLIAIPCAAQQTVEPAPERQLTKEEKKALVKAEKERKKYPEWITVLEQRSVLVQPRAVGYVGWCGGNLSWMFCVSSPINTAGGEVKFFRARFDSTGQERDLVCEAGLTSGRLILYPGRYPAKKRRFAGLVEVLANHNGKLKKLTCGRP